MMQAAELDIPTQQSQLDLPPAEEIKINDIGPVMRTAGNIVVLVPMNFSFPPSGRGGLLRTANIGGLAAYEADYADLYSA